MSDNKTENLKPSPNNIIPTTIKIIENTDNSNQPILDKALAISVKTSYKEDDDKNNLSEFDKADINTNENDSIATNYSKWNKNSQSKIYQNEVSPFPQMFDYDSCKPFELYETCNKTGLLIVEKSPKGRYARFAEEIGKGSFKIIYKAYDYDEGKEVAWSIIGTQDKSEHEINKIYDEINLLKTLKFEYIIKYFNGWYNEEKHQVVLISELFTGGSLIHYLIRISLAHVLTTFNLGYLILFK